MISIRGRFVELVSRTLACDQIHTTYSYKFGHSPKCNLDVQQTTTAPLGTLWED